MADFAPLSLDLNSGFMFINSGRKNLTGPLGGSRGSVRDLVLIPTVQLAADGTSSVPNGASKMQMLPLLLKNEQQYLGNNFGQFWVVAVGDSADGSNYDWAIVSGGAPTTSTDYGCTPGPANATKQSFVNGAQVPCLLHNCPGLWLFSRQPVDRANTAVMMQTARRLGLDVTVLRSVPQKGCDYAAVASAASATITHAVQFLQTP